MKTLTDAQPPRPRQTTRPTTTFRCFGWEGPRDPSREIADTLQRRTTR